MAKKVNDMVQLEKTIKRQANVVSMITDNNPAHDDALAGRSHIEYAFAIVWS